MKITTELDAFYVVPSITKPNITVSMTIANDGNKDLVLRFSSGQQFDIILRDADGNEIRRWSEGMMFMQMLNEAVIPSNGHEKFSGEISLLDSQQQPLADGSYQIEFELKGSPALAAENFAPLRIHSIVPLFIGTSGSAELS